MARNKKQSKKEERESILKSIPKPQLDLASETKRGIAVVVFLILAGITILAIIGSGGGAGQAIFKIFAILFGVLAYLMPIVFLLIAYLLFKSKSDKENTHPYTRTYLGMFLAAGGLAGLIHSIYMNATTGAVALANAGRAGGWLGALFGGPTISAF